MNADLHEDIHWVGIIDWTVRDFHGYKTDRGSTYNAYLVRGEKTALIDTVKAPFAQALIENVRRHVDPTAIDYVVCNHAEPDHAGSLPVVMDVCSNATLLCNEECLSALSKHFDTSGWRTQIVDTEESISLGNLTLHFIGTPMVHWPESMFTYVPERKLLFSMDAFGQHYASAHRFDDEEPLSAVMQEAKTYYANIVMLYNRPIARALERAGGLDIEMIAPSHGIIWRGHIGEILSAYKDWVAHKTAAKVVVLYDTMWQSTGKMAHAIVEGATESDVDVKLHNVRASNLTAIATEALDAAVIAAGSPTLNKTLMPEMAAVLTYLKGLSPRGRAGLAFGSYGWSRGGAQGVEEYLQAMKVDILREPLQAQFLPTDDILEECREAGRMLAAKAIELAAS